MGKEMHITPQGKQIENQFLIISPKISFGLSASQGLNFLIFIHTIPHISGPFLSRVLRSSPNMLYSSHLFCKEIHLAPVFIPTRAHKFITCWE